uniref:Cka2 n=1 Tax=Arundo donax TaxID=35708 RepID=A0A0A8Y146_ARUDO
MADGCVQSPVKLQASNGLTRKERAQLWCSHSPPSRSRPAPPRSAATRPPCRTARFRPWMDRASAARRCRASRPGHAAKEQWGGRRGRGREQRAISRTWSSSTALGDLSSSHGWESRGTGRAERSR